MSNNVKDILSLGMQGYGIGQLHKALSRLGLKVADSEINNQTFGQSTRQAVLDLQEKQQLPQTGIIDAKTAYILNAQNSISEDV
jgi:peptidoglycan hydrolase-like protein with peptidoglycan-binding domain